jgi:hypothetical protein
MLGFKFYEILLVYGILSGFLIFSKFGIVSFLGRVCLLLTGFSDLRR